MKKLISAIVLILFVLLMLGSCAAEDNSETENIFPEVSRPVPPPPEWVPGMGYDEYFSVERDFVNSDAWAIDGWSYMVYNGYLGRYLKIFGSMGSIIPPYEEDIECISDTNDYMIVNAMENGWIYCFSYTEFFRVDKSGNNRTTMAKVENPPWRYNMSEELIYYISADCTLYRLHIASGTVDKGSSINPEFVQFWPISNYEVVYCLLNPEYEHYMHETGDDSGTYRYLEYRYNFQTNETVYMGWSPKP